MVIGVIGSLVIMAVALLAAGIIFAAGWQASRDELLRIPGLGTKTIDRLILARGHRTLRLDDLTRLAGSVRRARHALGHSIHGADRFRRRDRKPNVRPELLRLAKRGTNTNAKPSNLALAA